MLYLETIEMDNGSSLELRLAARNSKPSSLVLPVSIMVLERLGSHRSRRPCLSPQRTTYSPAPSTGADMSCLSPAVLIPSASPHSLPLRPPRPVPSWLCGPALHHATMPFCSEHRASASWDALVGRRHRASMLRRLRRLRCVPASPPHTRSLICPRNADPVTDV